MKKLISLFLVLCMACMLIPAMADEASVLGTWYLKEAVVGEASMSADMLGMSMSFEFKDDGTVDVSVAYGAEQSESASATWTQDGSTVALTSEGQTMNLTLADGVLTMEQEGGLMKFTREEASAPAEVSTTTVAAENEDAFFGTWKLTYMNIMDKMIPVSLLSAFGLDMDVTVTIEAGKANMAITMAGETQAADLVTTFADGKLSINEEDTIITMSLTESDDLAFELPAGESTYSVYLSPVAAEEAPAT